MSEPERLDAQGPAGTDLVRLEQVLTIFPHLLVGEPDPHAVGERLAQAAVFLTGARGAAVGLLGPESLYRLLAGYGLPNGYAARYHGRSLKRSELGAALAGDAPLLRVDEVLEEGAVLTYLLRFPPGEVRGALHLVSGPGGLCTPALALGRYLASLCGPAIANARRCQQMSEASRRKSDCLSAISHDLRAPLNTLVGYLGLMREGTFGPLNPEQARIAELLERQSLDLADLLTASLDLVCLEAGKVAVRAEEFSVPQLFEDLKRTRFASLKPTTSLQWLVEEHIPPLRSDRVKLREIVQNLVDNAARHADAPCIQVSARHLPASRSLELVVRDTGRGIPPQDLPRLFERFHTRDPARGGTGLGLYLVHCFTRALGGRVNIASRPGAGTTVRVEVPLTAPAPPAG